MKYFILALISCLAISCQPSQVDAIDSPINNPFFVDFNQAIDFASLNTNHVTEATTAIQKITNNKLEGIIAVDDNDRTFDNTALALDGLYGQLNDVLSMMYLVAYTHSDSAIRNNALASVTRLDQYSNEIQLNEPLYKAMKSYSLSDEAQNMTGFKAKFVNETVESFERNGFALSAEKREQLKTINDKLSEIGNQFSQNISNFKDSLVVSESDMDGLPDDYKDVRRLEDGTYSVDLSYPSYRPFMRYSQSDAARKSLSYKYSNRAYPENINVLQQLLIKRKEMAELLGHRSYSAYRLQDRMAKTPEAVWDFENKLKAGLRELTKQDYEEMLAFKQTKVSDAIDVKGWEGSYYYDQLLKEKYQLDGEEVKQYFALEDVIGGLFSITQSLFGLEYREIDNPSVWHKDVKMYEVMKDGKLKGRFYLDLHPRDNKYGHAACFPIKNGLLTSDGYQLPTASLVCNFPKATADKPALMPHRQVKTFFHEFGHVLHHLMSTAELSSQSGFGVAQDFVEAPSQIFENWVWDYEVLKMFAKHYDTRKVLPEELFNKMIAAKKFGSGIGASGQVFNGIYDLTLHDQYDPNGEVTTTEIHEKLRSEIFFGPLTEDTHFQTSFGHLNGYGSSYYGYLWSKVYALDMFSVFVENGIMDKTTGLRYRDIILANGGSKDELKLVKEFLGREPNNNAFLKELGLGE